MKVLNIMLLIVWCVLVTIPTKIAFSATYYVDQNHGSASDSNAGTSESAPWLTLKKATTTVVAGDTVIVKEGTYTDTTASSANMSSFNPSHSGSIGSPITFRSEPALAAKIGRHTSVGPAWGVSLRSYIVIDGFRAYGAVGAVDGSYNTIKNCEVTDGSLIWGDSSLDWGIYLQNSPHGLVANNYVHSMGTDGNGSHNTACIMLFGGSTDSIVEYNTVDGTGSTVYNAYGTKGGGMNRSIFRYNFGLECVTGFMGMGSTDGSTTVVDVEIYNNVIINSDRFIELDHANDGFIISNNSAYAVGRFLWAGEEGTSVNAQFYNNLVDGAAFYMHSPSQTVSVLLDYDDYNHTDNLTSEYWRYEWSPLYATLADYQAGTVFGDHSIDGTSIGYVNAGGTTPEDYKRSSYPTDGRGGAYPSVMGAYVTGSETIGYGSGRVLVQPPPRLRKE